MSEVPTKFELVTVPSDISDAIKQLGRSGTGAALLQSVISPDNLTALQNEVATISIAEYEDFHQTIKNKRGVEVVENYWEYLLDNNAEARKDLPHLHHLAKTVERLITEDLGQEHQYLKKWQANDSLIHYYDRVDGLGFHYDPPRYWGVVAIATLEGDAEFHYRDNIGDKHIYPVEPGDIVLMRNSKFFTLDIDDDNCIEHSVQNVAPGGRKSFVIRSNADKL